MRRIKHLCRIFRRIGNMRGQHAALDRKLKAVRQRFNQLVSLDR